MAFRIGVVGLGYRIGYLMQVIGQTQKDIEFVGYVDPNPAGLGLVNGEGVPGISVDPSALKSFNPGKQFDSLESLIAEGDLDLLMVGSPNHMHLEHLRIAIKSGIKTFTEKPVVTTEAETFELLELLQEAGNVDQVMIGLVLRYAPLYRDLIAARDAGQLGNIASIEASEHIAPYHGAFFMRDWRRNSKYSGGFMLEKCCHDLDLYQGLVGKRPKRVVSFGGRRSFVPENKPAELANVYQYKPSGWNGSDKVFDSDGDIIDYQTALIEYEGGENLCFHTNMNVPDEFRRFAVIGSKGMAEGDFIRNFFKLTAAENSETLVDKSYKSSNLSAHYGADEQMIEDIFNHLRHGEKLPVSILDGLEAGLTAIKLDEARLSHSVVDLTETWAKFDSFKLAKEEVA
ncbi:Gfo/Idh/MocA family protein [Maritalea mediterranea]|uniref:Gfo/Idh/MocA family oxidoreductase n=1 Tax=Maritalea mediterranea TaxID=2909667 RepID=A0ABS9E4C9_9HYPH|nr:Gfo/Idh/MocA family oxidoreductase [Maritalea mediterranea]MCF4097706.1 Gfo/Idh/MocA family oxidoreductase [Maritalea mediterranea]